VCFLGVVVYNLTSRAHTIYHWFRPPHINYVINIVHSLHNVSLSFLSSFPLNFPNMSFYNAVLSLQTALPTLVPARPKLKLSLFALYRPTRKYPADSKDFIGKNVLLFFYWSRPFFVLLFIVHLPGQLQESRKKLGNQCYF